MGCVPLPEPFSYCNVSNLIFQGLGCHPKGLLVVLAVGLLVLCGLPLHPSVPDGRLSSILEKVANHQISHRGSGCIDFLGAIGEHRRPHVLLDPAVAAGQCFLL